MSKMDLKCEHCMTFFCTWITSGIIRDSTKAYVCGGKVGMQTTIPIVSTTSPNRMEASCAGPNSKSKFDSRGVKHEAERGIFSVCGTKKNENISKNCGRLPPKKKWLFSIPSLRSAWTPWQKIIFHYFSCPTLESFSLDQTPPITAVEMASCSWMHPGSWKSQQDWRSPVLASSFISYLFGTVWCHIYIRKKIYCARLNTCCMSLSLPYLGVRGVRGISGGKPCLIFGQIEDSDTNQSNPVVIGNFTRKTERAQCWNSE